MGANVQKDRDALHRAMKAIISETQRSAGQAQLPGIDKAKPVRPQVALQPALPDRVAELVYEIAPRRRLQDLVLAPQVVDEVQEFLHEYGNAALLREHSLEPRHKLLLVGPPGNGKTSLAEAIATELSLPLLLVRYDAIVDSFLGETSSRIRRLMDYAALNPCVLFFDEFDAIGKERNDAQETGEIKRVVGTLLMQMDRLPSHAVVVCATNHPEMLDRAVDRRFQFKLEIDRPGPAELALWFSRFEESLGAGQIGITAKQFASQMAGENMSGVEAFVLNVRRRLVLSKGALSAPEAVRLVMDRAKKRLKQQIDTREDDQQLSDRPPPKRKKRSAPDHPPAERRSGEPTQTSLPTSD